MLLGRIRKHRWDYLFMAPVMIVFTVFIILPTLWTIYASVHDLRMAGVAKFIGLTNYGKMWTDSVFLLAFRHTVLFSVSITALSIVLGFLAALLVNDLTGPARYFARSAIFMPATASLIVTAFVWRSFLEPDGLIQHSLAAVNVHTGPWLADTTLAFLSITLMSTWQRFGYNMIFFLAGLQSIPQMFYEAAEVDGASSWVKFRHITLPLIQRITLFVLVMNTIYTFLMFEQVITLTGGGPAHATLTLMINIYNQAFRRMRYGYASAMAIVFSAVVFTISIIQMYVLRRAPEY